MCHATKRLMMGHHDFWTTGWHYEAFWATNIFIIISYYVVPDPSFYNREQTVFCETWKFLTSLSFHSRLWQCHDLIAWSSYWSDDSRWTGLSLLVKVVFAHWLLKRSRANMKLSRTAPGRWGWKVKIAEKEDTLWCGKGTDCLKFHGCVTAGYLRTFLDSVLQVFSLSSDSLTFCFAFPPPSCRFSYSPPVLLVVYVPHLAQTIQHPLADAKSATTLPSCVVHQTYYWNIRAHENIYLSHFLSHFNRETHQMVLYSQSSICLTVIKSWGGSCGSCSDSNPGNESSAGSNPSTDACRMHCVSVQSFRPTSPSLHYLWVSRPFSEPPLKICEHLDMMLQTSSCSKCRIQPKLHANCVTIVRVYHVKICQKRVLDLRGVHKATSGPPQYLFVP